jgi:hypothetical protein
MRVEVDFNSDERVQAFCDFQMAPKEREELESIEIQGLKNGLFVADMSEDCTREIIYY